MTTMTPTQLYRNFREAVARVEFARETIILKRRGKIVGRLVPEFEEVQPTRREVKALAQGRAVPLSRAVTIEEYRRGVRR